MDYKRMSYDCNYARLLPLLIIIIIPVHRLLQATEA